MTSQASDVTVAAAFLNSQAIADGVDLILKELREAQASLTAARPAPGGELAEQYEEWLARQAQVKGKPALYPYVGSGLGNGPLVELADGSVKWDLINGIGVHMFGHSDPDLVATAIRAAACDIVMQGNLQFNTDAIEFGELLIQEASRSVGGSGGDSGGPSGGGSRLKHAFLINSGAMANESALKVCFQKTAPACRVMAFNDCFLGRSMTMAQIGDSAAGRVGLPLSTLVDYVPFYDPEDPSGSTQATLRQVQALIHRYPGQHACLIVELIQGEGGFNIGPREFHEPVMKLCRDHGIAIWVDEVQTFGRTTEMFAFQLLGLGAYVDVVTLGKMSQVCAVLFTEEFNPKPGLLSATFVGSTVSLQVGRRILQRLRGGGYYGPEGKIAALQNAFRQRARALVERRPDLFPPVPHPSGRPRTVDAHYSGVGGMMRLTPFAGEKAKVMKALNAMFEDGVIAFYCGHGPYHIRFLPPVGVMQPQQFAEVFEIVEGSLSRAAGDE
jgi:4-aminobutyrate aminotransferase-like enzyme